MLNEFNQFNILDLISNDDQRRKAAEQIKQSNKLNAEVYSQFLINIVISSTSNPQVQLAFSLMRQLITDGQLSLQQLVKILNFFSQLYLAVQANPQFLIFQNILMTALFKKIDSLDVTAIGVTNFDPITLKCFIQKQKLFLQKERLVNQYSLLTFLCTYLEYVRDQSLQLKYFQFLPYCKYFRNFQQITYRGVGNQTKLQQFNKIKNKFTILVLGLADHFSTKAFLNSFESNPGQACRYVIKLINKNKINKLQIYTVIQYFYDFVFKNQTIKTSANLIMAVSQCFYRLLQHWYEDIFFSNVQENISIKQAKIAASIRNQIKEQFDEDNQSQEDQLCSWTVLTLQDKYYNELLSWVIECLVISETVSQGIIFRIIECIDPIFSSTYKPLQAEQKIVIPLLQILLQNKFFNSPCFQDYSFYSYFILAYYYSNFKFKKQKILLAEKALNDLTAKRFSNKYNSNSLLLYLRKFVINMTSQDSIQFYLKITKAVLQLSIDLEADQIPSALIICLTPFNKSQCTSSLSNSEMSQQVNNQIWPIIATSHSQKIIAILQSLSQIVQTDEIVFSDFLQQLLTMISQNNQIFQIYYEQNNLAVRTEYMKLIAVCIAYNTQLILVNNQIIDFLNNLLTKMPTQIIQIQAMLDIYFEMIKNFNKNKNFEANSLIVSTIHTLYKYPNFTMSNHVLITEILCIQFLEENKTIIPNLLLFDQKIDINQRVKQMKLHELIIFLQYKVIRFILKRPNDQRCDAIQVFIMHNPMTSKVIASEILQSTFGTNNYYRMVYLLGPTPYPNQIITKPPTELKHYKWIALYLIGKFIAPSFPYAREQPNQEQELAQQMTRLGYTIQEFDRSRLQEIKSKLKQFWRDQDQSWMASLKKCSVYEKMNDLYSKKYTTMAIIQTIDNLIKSHCLHE